MTADSIIRRFHLEPLPVEGGLYHRHYASDETITGEALPERYPDAKPLASAICYMHLPETRSLMHRLRTDEIYHFYNGDPVTLVLLYPGGESRVVVLGQDYSAGHVPFFVVPRGVWQGSCLQDGGSWALLGATMAPAYHEDDFELGARAALLRQYPDEVEWIEKLTKGSKE